MVTDQMYQFCAEMDDEGEVLLFDIHSEKKFTVPEVVDLVESSLKSVYPKAGVVSCHWTGTRIFKVEIGGYKLGDQEQYLKAQHAAYDVAEQFHMAIDCFVAQLNGWSFTLELV